MNRDATPSDVVAARVREVRTRRGLTAEQLATRCQELGAKLTTQGIYKIETARESATRPPRQVTVDELLVLADALDVAPVHLLVPPDDYETPYHVTPTVTEANDRVRGWIRGLYTLRRLPRVGAQRDFYTETPPDEFEAMQDGQCLVCGGRPPREIKIKERS
jgi:transcriptional regulator with XRE-family HTH domain